MFLLKKFNNIFLEPKPSLFDVLIGGFLFIPWLKSPWQRSVFFVFYIFFLVIISLSLKPKREYKSIPLSLIALWSFIGVFVHSFAIYPTSRTLSYINYYLAIEGFLYIFAGVLFVITVIRYSTNLRFILILLPIAIFPWYSVIAWKGSVTPIAALSVAIVMYLFLSKRPKWGIVALIWGITGAVLKWSWICMKFTCRPMVWHQMVVNMFYRPLRTVGKEVIDPGIELSPFLDKIIPANIKPWLAGLVGKGFSDYLDPEYTWVDKDVFGWSYQQNDYMFLAGALGPIMLIFIIWFIIKSLKQIGIQPALILFMALIISCFFQLTMWFPDKAGIYLIVGSFAICEGIKKEEIA